MDSEDDGIGDVTDPSYGSKGVVDSGDPGSGTDNGGPNIVTKLRLA